jgi:hypothetical protein
MSDWHNFQTRIWGPRTWGNVGDMWEGTRASNRSDSEQITCAWCSYLKYSLPASLWQRTVRARLLNGEYVHVPNTASTAQYERKASSEIHSEIRKSFPNSKWNRHAEIYMHDPLVLTSSRVKLSFKRTYVHSNNWPTAVSGTPHLSPYHIYIYIYICRTLSPSRYETG